MPELVLLMAGGELSIPAEPGETILAASLRAGAGLQTVCKGRGICGACRITVPAEFVNRLAPPSTNEARLLRYLAGAPGEQRLACQITLDDSLHGIRVTPAPLPIRTTPKETAA